LDTETKGECPADMNPRWDELQKSLLMVL